MVQGPITDNQLQGGSKMNVKNIYINGNANIPSGGSGGHLGSTSNDGTIFVNGFLKTRGGRDIYGKLYINANNEKSEITNGARVHNMLNIKGSALLTSSTFSNSVYIQNDAEIKDSTIAGTLLVNGNCDN